ncbi:MAG: N-acetyltransferase [Sphingomonadales bacterium]
MIAIEPETAGDAAAIEALLDQSFGHDRWRKTAYRLRDGVADLRALAFVARQDGRLVGTIRFWPILLRDQAGAAKPAPALLLGPIAIAEHLRGKGVGMALIEAGVQAAQALGHVHVLLVGDAAYYGRAGFSAATTGGIGLPGPFDPARLLARQINPGPALPAAAVALPAFAQPGAGQQAQQQAKRRPGRHKRRFAHA